jgi:hypothetical protein
MIIVLEHSLPAEYECLCQFDTGEEFPANLIVPGAFLSSAISISHASTIFRLSLAFSLRSLHGRQNERLVTGSGSCAYEVYLPPHSTPGVCRFRVMCRPRRVFTAQSLPNLSSTLIPFPG